MSFMVSSLNVPDHWHQRAIEAREQAEKLTDPEAKRLMLEVAETYEKLAKRALDRISRR
jgi:hypothetical protein